VAKRPTLLLVVIALFVTLSSPVRAQVLPDPDRSFEALALMGARGSPEHLHPFAGIDGAFGSGQWKATGQTLLGNGNGFASALLWGGVGARFTPHARLQVRISAGPGMYWERRAQTGEHRTIVAPVLSALATAPVGPLRLALGATAFAGRYSGPDVDTAITARGVRLVLGLGR